MLVHTGCAGLFQAPGKGLPEAEHAVEQLRGFAAEDRGHGDGRRYCCGDRQFIFNNGGKGKFLNRKLPAKEKKGQQGLAVALLLRRMPLGKLKNREFRT